VARRISPMPTWFPDDRERDYWTMAQDIAYRAGVSLIDRAGSSWLISDDGERLICERPERLWFETWKVLHSEYRELSRQWVGGRPRTKPGE
jgi:hypothetical protein